MAPYDYTPTEQPAPPKRRGGLRAFLIVLAAVLVLGAAVALLYKPVKYYGAIALYEGQFYELAEAQFDSLSGYKEADFYANRSRYELAEYAYWTGNYEQAIEDFLALGDFENSPYRLKACYYALGMRALSEGEYEAAVAHFENAGDYEDAAAYLQQTIYEWGHSLFTQEKYAEAEEVFARLNGVYPDYGAPHFMTLDEAWAYLAQQRESLTMEMYCYVAQMPEIYKGEQLLWDVLSNKVTYHVFAVAYDWESQLLAVQVTSYYPSDRMLYAWRTGDETVLQTGEKEVLEQALALVEQAKSETDDDFALERWLHDWLCENIVYSNPDMSVPTPEYLKLRELTCVGALVDGTANCQGYTDAFYLLGNLAGLQVKKLTGESEGAHTWNAIRLEDAWYIVDVTFDDLEDEDPTAKTYIWFNCAYAADERTIHGGPEVLPGLAQSPNWDVTYYGHMGSVYDSLDDAVYTMLCRYAQKGSGWTYAVVLGTDADADDFYAAVDRKMTSAGVWSASWTSVIEYIGGNTYLSIYWE